MRFLSSLSLAFKLSVVLSLIVAGVAAAIGSAMVGRDWQRLHEGLSGRAFLLARSVAVTAPEPLLRGDSWTLYKVLRQLTSGPDAAHEPTLVAAMILDPEGRVLAHLNPALYPIGLPLLADNSPERPRLQSELAMKEASGSRRTGFHGRGRARSSQRQDAWVGSGPPIDPRIGKRDRSSRCLGASSLFGHCTDRHRPWLDLVDQDVTATARIGAIDGRSWSRSCKSVAGFTRR